MIDFVILWVDGNDLNWQDEYNKYAEITIEKSQSRYRDWNNLQYWFRGVEQFAPWVHKIYFVTWGHIPKWLNLNHSKLSIVKHSDFIPAEYLPTFNSHTIELNLHRIKGLSDKFVYFNDDHFILKHIDSTRFFRNELPCDMAVCNVLQPNDYGIDHIQTNNISLINRHFNKRSVFKANPFKWFCIKYKGLLYRTIALYPWSLFTGFMDPHMPNAYLKDTFKQVWDLEYETLHKTCCCKFRSNDNINQYIFRYWQLCNGNFIPINVLNDSIFYQFTDDDIEYICEHIAKRSKSLICISDNNNIDFERAKFMINESLKTIFPYKSNFEL